MKKKKVIVIFMPILLVVLIAVGVYLYYPNMHVKFEDENMGKVICKTINNIRSDKHYYGDEKTLVSLDTVTYKDLEQIEYLHVGSLSNYETLEDIEKCKNLEDIVLNYYREGDYVDRLLGKGMPEVLSQEKVEQFRNELSVILPKLEHLEEFSFHNFSRNCEIADWTFLTKCEKLEEISFYSMHVEDLNYLNECNVLKILVVSDSDISTADAVAEISGLEVLAFYNTPLAENEEEINKLKEAMPNTNINYDYEE